MVQASITPTREPAPTPEPEMKAPYEVTVHPQGPLFVGDIISLEVIDNAGDVLAGKSIDVREALSGQVLVEEQGFTPFGIGGRTQATLMWLWDTSGLLEGQYQLHFSVQPDAYEWTETITLTSPDKKRTAERYANWQQVRSDCCIVHYISGTAAERDAVELVNIVDEHVSIAAQQLGYELDKPISFTFFPRVLGHGGFTQEDISIAYLDRNYAGSDPEIVLHHEIVHALDVRIGGELRPTIMSEGLAVYLSGGHFKQELLMPRAAALLEPDLGCVNTDIWTSDSAQDACSLGWYLPLNQLLDEFYYEQHEIGYLQAGALVEFIIETWGRQAFTAFYRDIHPVKEAPQGVPYEGGSHALAIEMALWEHFDISIGELEHMFIESMQALRLPSEHVKDIRYSVEYYETVRRYQKMLDPSAHFLNAWLPNNDQMRDLGIVADYLRHPVEPENLALEAMLVEADDYLQVNEYLPAGELLTAVNDTLGVLENGASQPFTSNTLALDYLQVVQTLQSEGYDPVKISLNENQARVQVIRSDVSTSDIGLIQNLVLIRTHEGWAFASEAGN